jgi:hypothetical protein
MPLARIHDFSKQLVEELTSQLGLSTDGSLEDVGRRMKEKLTVIEAYLPSQSRAAKSSQATKSESQIRPNYCIFYSQ